MTRLVTSLCAVLALSCVAATAAPAAQGVGSLTPSDARFPLRSFVLTLPPGVAPSPGDVSVEENGQPVTGLRVVPADTRFAVLLVIDASPSMKGAPIQAAMAAARAFAAQRPAAQALGVVTFNGGAHVALKPTTDAAAIARVLRQPPPLAPHTHIYDAAISALGELKGTRYDAGALLILSDGHDLGSTATAAQVGAEARRVHAHLFSVGLRSNRFEPSTLQSIAQAGRGEYLGAASAATLADVYRKLGIQLANAFSIRYRSLAPAGSKVEVTAGAGDLAAHTVYSAPGLRIPGAVDPNRHAAPEDTSFFGTSAGAVVVAVVVMLLVLLALVAVLGSRQRHAQLHSRVSEYAVRSVPRGATPTAPDRAGRRGRRRSRMDELTEQLDIARLDITAERLVWLTVAGAFLLALVCFAIGWWLVALVALVAVPLAVRGYVRRELGKQRREFADQLADTVQAMSSSMRTGNSFVGAMAQVSQDSPEPMAAELRRVVADERLGVPLEDAVETVVERMDNRDLRQVGLVSVLQRETGGNGAEALDRVVQNIHARDDVRRLVRTLTAQGKFAQRVLSALPVVTLIGLTALNPEQMKPLYTTTAGNIALAASAVLIVIGATWIRKVVDIRV